MAVRQGNHHDDHVANNPEVQKWSFVELLLILIDHDFQDNPHCDAEVHQNFKPSQHLLSFGGLNSFVVLHTVVLEVEVSEDSEQVRHDVLSKENVH